MEQDVPIPQNINTHFNDIALNYSLVSFPFSTKLSFDPLFEQFEKELKNNDGNLYLQKKILKGLKNFPELRKTIEDVSELTRYEEVMDLVVSSLFPVANMENALTAITQPFQMEAIYSTPKYREIINFSSHNTDEESAITFGKTLHAYKKILKQFYNKDVLVPKPILFNFPEKETGLNKYYKININDSYCKIIAKKPVKPLSAEEIAHLLDNFWDVNLWMEHIPPENFEFHGFYMLDFIDVTDQEALSAIKYHLLDKGTIISGNSFTRLQDGLRDYFRTSSLRLGLVAFNYDNSNSFDEYRKNWNSIAFSRELECTDYKDSIYEKVCLDKKPVAIESMENYRGPEKLKRAILDQGIKSLIVAPLTYDGEIIGLLEIGAEETGHINSFSILKAKELIALFSIAVKRSMDELESEVEAVIKEEYTAIHPTVAWKFTRAAYKMIHDKREGKSYESESIVFSDVYPLFGLSDIRNSSIERNKAIKDDLIEHLKLVKNVIEKAIEHKPLPILKELNYRSQKKIDSIKKGLSSGDEVSILEFIKTEVEPVFDYLTKNEFFLGDAYHTYKNALDAEYGTLYRKRKSFEDSLTKINYTISSYLELEDEKAQEMFPHYFEKYKTDGVEYNIYIGNSLVQHGGFDMLHLRNMRLWQLKLMSEVARISYELKPNLDMPLDTTHLILVQSNPLAIRFRQDEKKFDVDGAYNIRYEIVKKRIDKAYIKGTSERLTQPGMIAIVYTQPREADEYRKYIAYLQAEGYLQNKIEDLELEELQGAQGLKALRVQVDLKSDRKKRAGKPTEKLDFKDVITEN
ncbi:GAF domain-containing protein [Fulvivirgaceae bacterium BMA10]|uniref:GAF domain-containing protein n=1 Tax=Splendidivirga corallicola TaxID=3051826 RepID=A0ABT8KSL7_9BACT|nr:GAF domain-containing protein [Fulvivirgaceae bacterium BMA10]